MTYYSRDDCNIFIWFKTVINLKSFSLMRLSKLKKYRYKFLNGPEINTFRFQTFTDFPQNVKSVD